MGTTRIDGAFSCTKDTGDMCVVSLVKPFFKEKYIFIYSDNQPSRAETLRTLGRFASDKELSFSWYDAAMLSQKIRNQE